MQRCPQLVGHAWVVVLAAFINPNGGSAAALLAKHGLVHAGVQICQFDPTAHEQSQHSLRFIERQTLPVSCALRATQAVVQFLQPAKNRLTTCPSHGHDGHHRPQGRDPAAPVVCPPVSVMMWSMVVLKSSVGQPLINDETCVLPSYSVPCQEPIGFLISCFIHAVVKIRRPQYRKCLFAIDG